MKPTEKKLKNESEVVVHPMRTTQQRTMIIEVLKATFHHPTADWIYGKVRKKCPHVSLGTIYRNLNLLKEKGLIRELKFGKNTARYDGNANPHHHLLCIRCGKLEDFECKIHRDINTSAEKLSGYKIVAHHLELWGICPECLKSEVKRASKYT